MAQEVFYTHFQGKCRRRASGARALHMQINYTAVKTMERNVTTVLCYSWAYARVQQFFNLDNDRFICSIVIAFCGSHRLTI